MPVKTAVLGSRLNKRDDMAAVINSGFHGEWPATQTRFPGAACPTTQVYVSPSVAPLHGQSLQIGGESVAIASVSEARLIEHRPPLKASLLLTSLGAGLVVIGAIIGATGIGIVIAGITCSLFSARAAARRRSRTKLIIGTVDGRSRILYSCDSEVLEQLAHELRQIIARRRPACANDEVPLVSVQSA